MGDSKSRPTTPTSAGRRRAATEDDDDDGAERMFAAARSLHLRRHRSRASRANALRLFRETMRLRPGWKETDSRFAVESGIDDVFKALELPRDALPDEKSRGGSKIAEREAMTGGVRGVSGRSGSSAICEDVLCLRQHLDTWGYTARTVQERFGVGEANGLPGPYYLRKSLDHNHAALVTAMGQPKDPLDVAIRLFLLGLALPRAQAERSLGRDFLDSAGRLGMLGECPVDPLLLVSLVQLFPLDAEALPPSSATEAAGGERHVTATKSRTESRTADKSAARGATTASPAECLSSSSSFALPPPSSRGSGGDSGCGGPGSGGIGGECDGRPRLRRGEGTATPSSCSCSGDGGIGAAPTEDGAAILEQCGVVASPSREARGGGIEFETRREKGARPSKGAARSQSLRETEEADSVAASAGKARTGGVVAASDMVFATDWPPPGSTALTEDPYPQQSERASGFVRVLPTSDAVMYIGPDSIGLVLHAPRGRAPSSPAPAPAPSSPEESRRHHRDHHDCHRHRADGDKANEDGALGTLTRHVRRSVAAMKSSFPSFAEETTAEEAGTPGEGRAEEVLDLCCGSGVQGIAAAVVRRGEASVTCVDVSPRAVRFARLNALLNGLDLDDGFGSADGPGRERRRFRAVVGDLYAALAPSPPVTARAAVGFLYGARGASLCGEREQGCSGSRSVGGGGDDGSSGGGGGNGTIASTVGPSSPSSLFCASARAATTAAAAMAPMIRARQPLAVASGRTGHYDLILANPPFVPVPPRLGAVRRRYDLFASGGATGEEVIEGILRGAVDHLRPGGGVLAMVTELANPRTFDDKLRRWVEPSVAGGVGAERTAATAAAADDDDDDRFDGRGSDAENDGNFNGCGGDDEGAAVVPAWTGVVFHERKPWTAREYASRRAGSPGEAQGWERHLREVVGIDEMSAGFVFVRRTDNGAGAGAGDGSGGDRSGNRENRAGNVEVRGVEKLWAPHNREAVKQTSSAVDKL